VVSESGEPGFTVIVGESAGFCWGVERAINIARDTAAQVGQIETVGQLVHNTRVVSDLAKEGITSVGNLEEVRTETAVVSTHGLPPAVIAEAKRRGVKLVDATCPTVAVVQKRARQLLDEGYEVFIVGKRDHPEVIGVQGWVGGKATVIGNREEAEALPRLRRIGIVSQTTVPQSVFSEIATVLVGKAREAKIFNTLCSATLDNQAETEEIAQQVDLMLVIGSPHSANTRHLAEVARAVGTRAELVEDAEQVTEERLGQVRRVGITGGASCPKELIWEVEAKVRALLAAKFSGEGRA